MNKNIQIEVKSIPKWNTILESNISYDNWKYIFNIAIKAIEDNTFKWFQYKILHRILGTKSLTFKMGLTQTNLCGLCHTSEETLIHLFTECNRSNIVWASLANEINTICNLNITIDQIEKLFGYQNNTSFADALNTILTIMRYYIFVKSKSQGTLFMSEYKRLLKRVYVEQQLLSQLNNKNEIFKKKWLKLANYITPTPAEQ